MAPTFSILITSYNRSELTNRAVRSCLDQTFKDFELIVIDDCSPQPFYLDEQNAKDPRARVIKTPRNVGQCGANNLGIREALGKYISFLDCDDHWQPNKLEVVKQRIDGIEDGQDFVVFSNVFIDLGGGNIIDHQNPPIAPDENVINYLFFKKGVLQTSTLTVSAEVAKGVMFNPDFRNHSDYDFVWRVHLAGAKFYHVDETLATWCCDERPDRVSKRNLHTIRESQRWIDEISLDISEPTRLILESKLVARWSGGKNMFRSMGTLFQAFRAGAIDYRYFLSSVTYLLMGEKLHGWIKKGTVGESSIYG